MNISPNSKGELKAKLVGLTNVQFEAAIGLILDDAFHVYDLFKEWILTEPKAQTRINSNGNEVITWRFQTFSHEAFNPLAELFLRVQFSKGKQGKKMVKDGLIRDHLTPILIKNTPHIKAFTLTKIEQADPPRESILTGGVGTSSSGPHKALTGNSPGHRVTIFEDWAISREALTFVHRPSTTTRLHPSGLCGNPALMSNTQSDVGSSYPRAGYNSTICWKSLRASSTSLFPKEVRISEDWAISRKPTANLADNAQLSNEGPGRPFKSRLDFIMWQAVWDMMNRKDHLKVGGIELKIRELQRHNRAFIHPIVLNAMMHLRPDLGERLRDRDIVQTPTSDLSLKNSLWDKESFYAKLRVKKTGIIAIRKNNVQRLEGEYTNNNPSTSARDKFFVFPVLTILPKK
ncbi:6141_t:CDS:10 [Funneliformis geosporum]|nr:6141_t:CDS:10 [Funneliformis geosporum]